MSGLIASIKYALAILSQVATFDGKKLVPEELMKLKIKDFFGLAKAIEGFGLEELAKELWSSQEKQG
ncbi:MAG: hypothetical protein NC908_05630 [Candidatus Omnitrophica bacterium]|nr:hypothetical protein [Candidatus Omnitrophota bacterium]